MNHPYMQLQNGQLHPTEIWEHRQSSATPIYAPPFGAWGSYSGLPLAAVPTITTTTPQQGPFWHHPEQEALDYLSKDTLGVAALEESLLRPENQTIYPVHCVMNEEYQPMMRMSSLPSTSSSLSISSASSVPSDTAFFTSPEILPASSCPTPSAHWLNPAAAQQESLVEPILQVVGEPSNLQPESSGEPQWPTEQASAPKKTPKRFGCSICPKEFTRKESLKNHIISVHHKLRPHKCGYGKCRLKYSTPSDLRRHIREKHKGSSQKLFKCQGYDRNGHHWGCGKGFYRSYQLANHWKSKWSQRKCGIPEGFDFIPRRIMEVKEEKMEGLSERF